MNPKRFMLIAGAVAVLAAAGVVTYVFWPDGPPPNPETAKSEEVTKYLASDQFAKLPVEKKQDYLEQVHKKSEGHPRRVFRSARDLSEKEREKLHENMRPVFMAMMRKRMDAFFELPPKERNAYLDRMIDAHENRRQEWQRRREQRESEGASSTQSQDRSRRRGAGRHRRHRMSPERLKRMIERTPAKDRARFMEFIKAMRKRREERGLPNRWH